jgi:hypothetical protein
VASGAKPQSVIQDSTGDSREGRQGRVTVQVWGVRRWVGAAGPSHDLVPNCTSSRYAEKRQGTAALQDASAFFGTLLLPQGFGVRLSSAAFIALISAGKH